MGEAEGRAVDGAEDGIVDRAGSGAEAAKVVVNLKRENLKATC
jgi:hypothetical protein